MSIPVQNPSGCCGVKTDCCTGKIPDILHVEIETDCGTYFAKIPLTTVNYLNGEFEEAIWYSPSVSFKCRYEPESACDQISAELIVKCSGSWQIEFCGNASLQHVECKPLLLVATFSADSGLCDCFDTPRTVTVTE